MLFRSVGGLLPFLLFGLFLVGDAPYWVVIQSLQQAGLAVQGLALGTSSPAIRVVTDPVRRILFASFGGAAVITVLGQQDEEVSRMVVKKVAKGLVGGTASLIQGTIDTSAEVVTTGYQVTKDSAKSVARNAEKLVKKILE